MKKPNKLPDPQKDMPAWYQELLQRAELAEWSSVKGFPVIRPNAFAIWELIQQAIDLKLKERNVRNAYFPLLIPQSLISREKDHVAGFAPEFAVVTEAGGAKLSEPLIVRPTSETIIHESMARWITSYRDLPMRLNVWGNVVRWEKRPRLFLRGSEFLWQEGHTAHVNEAYARREVQKMVALYYDIIAALLAIPTVKGMKSDDERFAGAVESHSVEGLMPDGRGLQMGTIHYLGEKFSKMANVTFVDRDGTKRFVHMTSWGVSTRLIGALIMTHGDERGLVLPPRVAPVQVVVVPVAVEKDRAGILGTAKSVVERLKALGVRVRFDEREGMMPGEKFYEHDLHGVPLRIDIGPLNVAAGSLSLSWRRFWGKETVVLDAIDQIPARLQAFQEVLYTNALAALERHTIDLCDRDDFIEALNSQRGFIRVGWCGSPRCSHEIKQKTSATIRNLPYEQHEKVPNCIWCGTKGLFTALFAKAY